MPTKIGKLENIYRVKYAMQGVWGTSGIHHATAGEAYGEVADLSRNGFPNAIVEVAQVRVIAL